jgi:hypothetical protein
MTTTKLTGSDAIDTAAALGVSLYKYADAVDGAREVTIDEARAIAREDASLVWLTIDSDDADEARCAAYDDAETFGREVAQ